MRTKERILDFVEDMVSKARPEPSRQTKWKRAAAIAAVVGTVATVGYGAYRSFNSAHPGRQDPDLS
ncbi:MAG: hypothetical protein KF836_07230 [Fimbriimonadaceae bacterium]|nr:hypothetical protein [Fimbriimonadaceae bacterium]